MTWTLDTLMPRWDHHEIHRQRLRAEPDRIWDSLWNLRVSDLTVTETLARLRGGPRAWRRDQAAHADLRVMEAMAPRLLVADRPRELVLIDVAHYTAIRPTRPDRDSWEPQDFVDFAEPGWTKVAMNFRLTPGDDGVELSTQTRVLSTDPATKRSFALYWIPVRAGSGVMRRDILRTVAQAVSAQ